MSDRYRHTVVRRDGSKLNIAALSTVMEDQAARLRTLVLHTNEYVRETLEPGITNEQRVHWKQHSENLLDIADALTRELNRGADPAQASVLLRLSKRGADMFVSAVVSATVTLGVNGLAYESPSIAGKRWTAPWKLSS